MIAAAKVALTLSLSDDLEARPRGGAAAGAKSSLMGRSFVLDQEAMRSIHTWRVLLPSLKLNVNSTQGLAFNFFFGMAAQMRHAT